MSPFVNLSNHSLARWDARQIAAACALAGPVLDVPFPNVPAAMGLEGLSGLVEDTIARLPEATAVAMVAGEHTLTHALVRALQERGVRCLAAASERHVELGTGGGKHVEFRFERFRDYQGNPKRAGDEVAQDEVAVAQDEFKPPGKPAPAEKVVPVQAPPAETPAQARARRDALFRAIFQGAWYDIPSQVKAATRELLEAFPEERAEAERARADGQALGNGIKELQKRLFRHGAGSPEAKDVAGEIVRAFPFARQKVESCFVYESRRKAKATERSIAVAEGRPLTAVQARGEHRIYALEAAAAWTLWIDETGDRFGETSGSPGRVIGVLVPEGTILPTLPYNFHSSKAPDADVDAAVQGVLDAPVGVFGVAVDALGPAPGERWSDAVLEVVAWVARLLPLPADGPVYLDVHVEQRGDFTPAEHWRLGVRNVVRRLTALVPHRAARLELNIRTDPKDGGTPLGQADALAYTWGSQNPASRARFAASGLAGACCVDLPPALLRAAWDGWDGACPPDGPTWRKLVAAAGPGDEGTLLGRLLEDLAAKARNEPGLWAGWLEATAAHLDGKAVDLRAVGREVGWLATAAPDGATVPSRLRLMWLVARLAEGNHRGALDDEDYATEIDRLSSQLFDEDARLVCLADLHRAVLATNCLDLDGASAAVARWDGASVALPGIQLWGRLRSTIGQHHAFRNELGEARACLGEALAAFARLSDPAQGRLESGQTGAYLAIVSMDDAAVSNADARAAVEAVIGPLSEAIARLGPSGSPADKYSQHLLLRWLVARGETADLDAWLLTRDHWKVGEGHPWPLVAFYRAVLLDRLRGPAARVTVRDWATRAVRIADAPDQGRTVRLIGATLAAAATTWDVPWPNAEDRLADLRDHLPEANIGAIEDFLRHPGGDPLGLLARVLPFNFR